MIQAIFSYLFAVIQIVQIITGGGFVNVPVENNVIDVTFDFMNGQEAYTYQVEEGSLIKAPETPENRGLIFNGWYNGNEKWDFSKNKVTSDVTLTAKWKFSDSFYNNDPNASVRAEGSNLRIMSFNILASDWSNKPAVKGRDDKVRDVISRYKPDVVGLQEVNAEWYESLENNFSTYKLVNEDNNKINFKVNYSTIAYNTETVNLIRWGQSAYMVNYNKNCRNFMWAIFELKSEPGKQFMVTSTHFDLTSDRRVHQAIEMSGLVRIIEGIFKIPVYCTGDFNMREDSEEYMTFMEMLSYKSAKYASEKKGLVAVTTHLGDGTGSADDYTSGYYKLGKVSYRQSKINSIKSIDHIFVPEETRVLYYDTIVDETALEASDHCPIYADILV